MKCLKNLSPQPLWNYFEEICQAPRPSKKEEKIIKYILDFADKNGLKSKKDKVGNVLIKKPAYKGYETKPSARLGKLLHVPHYRKILHGTKAIQAIGIDKLLAECLHFSAWYGRLTELKN